MLDFFNHLFDSSGFPPRWHCGDWTTGHGWLHILSDGAIFAAYYIIPAIIAFFLARRKDLPFPRILWLFVGFILACGTTHALDALMFWEPVYRLSGLMKLTTAVVSWATVFALISVMPSVMKLRTPADLQKEVDVQTAELRAAQAKLRAADRRKNEFLSILSHELRNPLAPISTALDLMTQSGSDAFREERAAIRRQVQHMTRLVDDLLDVARISQGKILLRKTRLDLSLVVQEAAEHVSALIEERNHRLSVSVEEELVVVGDHDRVVQIISNLLNNAAKYTPPGGQLELVARRDGKWCEVDVRDNGVGIPEELRSRVFEMFTQDDRTLDRSRGGLGLGLAIVKQLVILHGGSLSVQPREGGGSEFSVRLPDASRESLPPVAHSTPPDLSMLKSKRVLVVDDNADARELLTLLLTSLGMEARSAACAKEAFSCIETWTPEIAVLDIGLPGMNGYELGSELKECIAGIPLIALSGYGGSDDRERSRRAGFAKHLTKPAEAGTLKEALLEVLPSSVKT